MEMKKGEIAMLILSVFLVLNIAASFLVPGYRAHLAKGMQEQFFSSSQSDSAPAPQPMDTVVCSGTQDPLAHTSTGIFDGSGSASAPLEKVKTLNDYAPNFGADLTTLRYSASGAEIFGIKRQDPILIEMFESEIIPSRIVLFSETYQSMKKFFSLQKQKTFAVKEVNNFFEKSFYLNSIKNDDMIRFVTQIGEHAVGFEVSSYWYPYLKAHLNKK